MDDPLDQPDNVNFLMTEDQNNELYGLNESEITHFISDNVSGDNNSMNYNEYSDHEEYKRAQTFQLLEN